MSSAYDDLLYDDLLAEIDRRRTKDVPGEAEQGSLRPIFSPVEGFFKALEKNGKASDFEEFPVPLGIGCSCKLDTNVLIVAHCLGPIDNDKRARIKVGKGATKKTIGEPSQEGQYAAPSSPSPDMIKNQYHRIFEFIIKIASGEVQV
jgi:hypothetical protein